MAPRSKNFASKIEIVPADGHYACQLKEHGDFGTSPSFRQLFMISQHPLSPGPPYIMGVPETKNNGI
jgi:hypothetical protein